MTESDDDVAAAAGPPLRDGADARPDEFLELVRTREQTALAALSQAAGDASLCALSRSGTPHPAARFHEGAAAALAAVRRARRRQPDASPGVAIAEARVGWEEQTAVLAARQPSWAAYRAGGVEALDLLADAVDASDHPATPPRP